MLVTDLLNMKVPKVQGFVVGWDIHFIIYFIKLYGYKSHRLIYNAFTFSCMPA